MSENFNRCYKRNIKKDIVLDLSDMDELRKFLYHYRNTCIKAFLYLDDVYTSIERSKATIVFSDTLYAYISCDKRGNALVSIRKVPKDGNGDSHMIMDAFKDHKKTASYRISADYSHAICTDEKSILEALNFLRSKYSII